MNIKKTFHAKGMILLVLIFAYSFFNTINTHIAFVYAKDLKTEVGLENEKEKKFAIDKAKAYVKQFLGTFLERENNKDMLNPENKIYNNSIEVSKDNKIVIFYHDGSPYDGNSYRITVKMTKDYFLANISLDVIPGGHI